MTDPAAAAVKLAPPPPVEFVVTKEHRRFAEFADAVREHGYIGVCYGPPGVGKTVSARHYAHWDQLHPWLEDHRFGGPDAPAALADATAALYTPTTFINPRQLDEDLNDLCRTLAYAIQDRRRQRLPLERRGPRVPFASDSVDGHIKLVIVDEADRLKTATLEQLRDFFDRHHFGLVLIGMPGLEKRLARYPQLYSRIGFAHRYRPLGADELRFVLAHHWQRLGLQLVAEDFTDAEAVAAITRVTNGNFPRRRRAAGLDQRPRRRRRQSQPRTVRRPRGRRLGRRGRQYASTEVDREP